MFYNGTILQTEHTRDTVSYMNFIAGIESGVVTFDNSLLHAIKQLPDAPLYLFSHEGFDYYLACYQSQYITEDATEPQLDGISFGILCAPPYSPDFEYILSVTLPNIVFEAACIDYADFNVYDCLMECLTNVIYNDNSFLYAQEYIEDFFVNAYDDDIVIFDDIFVLSANFVKKERGIV